MDTRYSQVFRDYGIDLDELEVDAAAERIRQSAICTELTGMIDDWAFARRMARGSDKASWKLLLAVARAADPNELRGRLRVALERGDRDVVREVADSEEVTTLPSPTVVLLADALKDSGETDKAVTVLRTASRKHRDDFWINQALTRHLHYARPPRFEEMVQFSRVTLALRPRSAAAASTFGDALRHNGALDEAVAECREAIRLNPDYPAAHINLGNALKDKGALEEAIVEHREAVRLKPDYASAHINLAIALKHKGALDEAIAEYREAIRLKPDLAEAHCNLGEVLSQKGRFSESLTELRLGHELGSRDPNWDSPSAQWVALAERLVELDAKLDAVLTGETKPGGAAELVEFAWLCVYYKHQNVVAARFYAEAFTSQPKLAADLTKQHRYNAACAAALAGCGQGEDAGSVGDEERTRLRQQALDWLRADLDRWRKLLEGDSVDARAKVVGTLKHWQTDSDLAGVRDAEALARLPESEREAWGKLWAQVEQLLGVRD